MTTGPLSSVRQITRSAMKKTIRNNGLNRTRGPLSSCAGCLMRKGANFSMKSSIKRLSRLRPKGGVAPLNAPPPRAAASDFLTSCGAFP